MTRPFRFLAPMPRLAGSIGDWRDELRRIEDLGYDAVTVSEHLADGWELDALTAMEAIAAATSRLRIMSLVLASGSRMASRRRLVRRHMWAAPVRRPDERAYASATAGTYRTLCA